MGSYLTEEEVNAILAAGFHKKTPYSIAGVSFGYFSIARYSGGAKYNGESYTYHPPTDELIRDDVLKFIKKLRKPKRKAKAAELFKE